VDLNYYLDSDSLYVDQLCYEDFMMINGVRIDVLNPIDTFDFPGMAQGGCDSTLIVNISFTGEAFEIFQSTLCHEDSILVNNNWYHNNNATGIEVMPGGSSLGCDSIVDVRLSFLEPVTGILEGDYCDGAFFEFNDNIYDINNPTGTEILENESSSNNWRHYAI